jgi:hypothetical protein
MALHVYPNKKEGKKILDSHGSIIRSTYTPEQTITLRLNLKANEYYKMSQVLNLVLDQDQRKKDLYFNIRIYSNSPF